MLNFSVLQDGMLRYLQAAGLISEAEIEAGLDIGQDLEGEQISMTMGDANLDFANVSFIVERALDQGADALITFSTPVTLAAINATQDMDDPPIVLFGSVYNPYAAGIAQSSCVKPAHVTGVESVTLYDEIVPLILLQNPEIQAIGTVYSASETSGRLGAEAIVEAAEALGVTVEEAAVTAISDLAPAAEGLIAKGAEALLIPSDLLTVAGLPALMQVGIENGIPVFHSTGNSVNEGATVSAGVSELSLQGRLIGSLLAGALGGDLDAGRTGIGSVSKLTVAVSADTAAMQNVELSEALLERADIIYKDGVTTGRRILDALASLGLEPELAQEVAAQIATAVAGGGLEELDLPPEVMQTLVEAFSDQASQDEISGIVAGLHCSDEMIAEQQAALDAMEG